MISRDEWLAAVDAAEVKAAQGDPDALLLTEVADLLGVHFNTARRKLKAMIAQGRATVTRKRIIRSDGQPMLVPAYKLTKK